MTDQPKLAPHVLSRDLGTEHRTCLACGIELLVERSGIGSVEAAPAGAWVGVWAYTEVPEHRTRRAYARRVGAAGDSDVVIVCSEQCRAG